MKSKIFTKAILFLFFIPFFTKCSSSPDNNIPQDIEIHDFVWKGLNAYYLWQTEKQDLADRRFSNQNQLNNYLGDYLYPEELFENLLYRPTDRFSWIVDDYIALENSFQGITLNNGAEFGLLRYESTPTNLFGYVRYVIPGSNADSKGITRGMIFNTIDDIQLTETNYQNLLFGNNTSYSIGFADYNTGNPITNGTSVSLTKTELQENPIAISKVITEGTKKIGYLLYNQFSSSYDQELNAVFNTFKSEEIHHLIIDLRYNGGGSVTTATYLGSMITGQFMDQLYSKEIWNQKVQDAISADRFLNYFTDQIIKKDDNDNIVLEESINSLNLSEVYFIVSGSTASASELVINSLRAYIDVKIIGTKTVGKQVGSVTLYDSEDLSRNGANLNSNHTYAMQPIVLEITNKNNRNELNGFIPGTTLPGIELAEDYGNLGVLGEDSDPLLDRTLTYITTGAKGNFKNKKQEFIEFYNSKLATPTGNNMYTDFKN